ncbi:hypothetical protein V6N13_058234 [Hibiscus sabdariffa]|uniref:Uncharacterized protein n=1 Tax=Hibiscus sabdariffa TaxID=183260 RepID=A0ABR2GGS0_9ROSI
MATLPESGMKVAEDVSRVSPPPGSVPTTSLPLSFFDKIFLAESPVWMQNLFFYEFRHPTPHFMIITLPKLKTSLSLTLQHFFPFAGNLIFPPSPQTPYILYTEGDSVLFTVDESTADFSLLAGDHARHYQEFQALVPKCSPAIARRSSGSKQRPIMAIQVTIFPDAGISIGVGFSHVAADGRTFVHFMKSWASLHRCQGDLTCLDNNLPSFNREVINDPLGPASGLLTMTGGEISLEGSSSSSSTFINNIRITCEIKRSEVQLLKDWVEKNCMEAKVSEPIRMSTFVVTCAYLWVCLIKLQQTGTHQHPSPGDSNSHTYFLFAAECRKHLKLPATYFGNCITLRLAEAKKSELLGQKGILVAATAIGREIMEFQSQPFKDAEDSLPKIFEKFKMRKDIVLPTSSPKFKVYETDFGWGRPKKREHVNVRSFGSLSMFSIVESREDDGGIEFGLALDPHELESFNAVFNNGLLKLQ